MARRGQLVGDAYVRIHADSSAIDNELRREFAAAGAKKAGKDAGKEFIREFDKAIRAEAKSRVRETNQALVRGIVGGRKEWDRQFAASGLASVDDFTNKVRRRLERIGSIDTGKGFKKLQKSLEELDQWAQDARVTEELNRVSKAIRDQNAAFKTYGVNIRSAESSTRKIEKAIRDQDRAWQTYADNVGEKLPNAFTRLKRTFDRDTSMTRYARRVDTVIPRALVRLNRHLDTSEHHFSRFADVMGKVFGKGSRNNFFNFVGSVVGGLSRIGVGVAHASLRLLTFVGTFGHIIGTGLVGTFKGLGDLLSGEGFGGITKALKGVGAGLGDLAVQIGVTLAGAAKFAIPVVLALAAAFTVMSVAVFPLIALVANLAGALFVLAAEISVALAGALLAVAPAAVALAAGIGFVVTAIVKLSNATGRAKKALKPLTDAWKDFNKQFEGKPLLDFAKALSNLAPLIKTVLTPLMKGFATAAAEVTDKFAAIFTGPRIQPALKAFLASLPIIFMQIGDGLAELTGGLIQFFQPILPFAERLATKFEELFTTFNDWASSAEGKNAIKDFMTNAWEAASDLWDIIVLVGQALGGLIGIATNNPDGDNRTVLDSIKDSLQGLVDWINSPEGEAAIQQFFTNAMSTAAQLGDSLKEIGTALASVDWETATARANTFLDFIGNVTSAITILGATHSANFQLMFLGWTVFGNLIRDIYNNIIGPVLSAIIGGFAGILTSISTLLRVLAKVPGMAFLNSVADELDRAIGKVNTLADNVRTLPDGSININVGLSGPGVAALQQSMARRRPDVFFGAAAGGILTAPTFIRPNVLAGEAGREAIVPLDRPLQLVDPSVRALAAFARGLPPQRMASGGITGGGVTISPGAIVVTVPNSDPVLVAEAVIDRFAAQVRI